MNEERPIEKLLRRYAKKRRDEGVPARELHPATRRMLQGEVSRQFPKSASKERSVFDEFLAAFARRWFYALGVFVVLLASAVLLLPNFTTKKPASQIALNERRNNSDAMTEAKSASDAMVFDDTARSQYVVETNSVFAAMPTSPVVEQFKAAPNNSTRKEKGFNGGGNIRPQAEPSTVAVPASHIPETGATSASAKRAIGKVVVTSDAPARTSSLASRDEVSRLAINTTKGSVADALVQDKARLARGGGAREKESEPIYRQHFSNEQSVATKAKPSFGKAASAASVLANFQIEQSGNSLRVIDSDGSTYHGQLSASQSEQQTLTMTHKYGVKTETALGAASQSQRQDGYEFRVEGTNRTLNQQVVFSWNCVLFTNALAFSNGNIVASELKKMDSTKMPQQFPALQNTIISGRAQIDSAKEIEINARPVSQ